MNKKFATFLVEAFLLIYSTSCQSQQSNSNILTPTLITTPTYSPIVTNTITAHITPIDNLILSGAPISKEFDLDGFEHLPDSSAGISINLSEERLALISKRIDSKIGLSSLFLSLPLIDCAYLLNSAKGGKELFLAGYQYKGEARSDIGILLFDSNDNIIYYSQPEIHSVQVNYRIVPVQLSETKKGVFVTVFTSTGGSGIFPTTYRKLLVLENEKLNLVWHWNNDAGGKTGAFNQKWNTVYTNFEDLSNNLMLDVTLEKQGRIISGNTSIWEYYPGKLVFSWVKDNYELSYFYDGTNLHPIHSNNTVIVAPGGSWGKLLEQLDATWFHSDRLRYNITWDNDNIYFHFTAIPDNVLQVALDMDLSGDFSSSVINSDDYVFEIEIPKVETGNNCLNAIVKPISPSSTKVNTTISVSGDYVDCTIDFTLSQKGLSDVNLVDTPAVIYSFFDEFNIPAQEYHRNYIASLGIAIQPKKFSDKYKFDINNPTTWGTLILISNH